MHTPKFSISKSVHPKHTIWSRLQSFTPKLILWCKGFAINLYKNKNNLLIVYKLLHDALLLLLLSFLAMLIAEGLLPGIISSHLSLARVAIAIVVILGGIIWIGNKFQLTYPRPAIKKSRLLPALILLSFLLIGNSLLKFALWQNMLITLIALFVFFLFYEIIFTSK